MKQEQGKALLEIQRQRMKVLLIRFTIQNGAIQNTTQESWTSTLIFDLPLANQVEVLVCPISCILNFSPYDLLHQKDHNCLVVLRHAE